MEVYWHRGVCSIVRNARVRVVQYQKAVCKQNTIHYFHKEE